MKIIDLSRHSKLENLHNQWLTKYFLAPLYIVSSHKCLFNIQFSVACKRKIVLTSLFTKGKAFYVFVETCHTFINDDWLLFECWNHDV